MNAKQLPDLQHLKDVIDEARAAEHHLLELGYSASEDERLTLVDTMHPDAAQARRHHFARELEARLHHASHGGHE